MKKQIFTLLILILTNLTIGQEIKSISDKEAYKLDEIIHISFEINVKSDSIIFPDLKNFTIISGPTKYSSTSILSGVTTATESVSYKLKANNSGQHKINSPIFLKDEKKIKGKPIKIKVNPSNLTEKEKKAIEYKNFIEESTKPKGTTRIVLHENKGYIEIVGETGWEFQRILTTEEIENLKNLSK